MKTILKFFKTVFQILSVLVYIVIIFYILIASPMLLGYKPVVVLSGSMEPAFPVGGVIYHKPASFEEIQVGDAVTFRAGEDTLVTHRVTVKNDLSRTFITKGDANPSEDSSPVEYSAVIGRTFDFCIPYAGYFIMYGKTVYAIVTMALIILIDILLDSLVSKKRKRSGGAAVEGYKLQ